MKKNYQFHLVFSFPNAVVNQQLELFALLNLGIVHSLSSGVLSVTDAIQRFYHAENCIYTQKHFKNSVVSKIMSHGVQLPDIFESLPPNEAQREFFHELESIRSLCIKLLEK
ncbi:hypothetical protein MHK_008209 [Candidatus Magnetomorum sp. HK-1]|nr:hypothetical protein MHK_008209 [Candidatus Magnetomorum sp. HK-1]